MVLPHTPGKAPITFKLPVWAVYTTLIVISLALVAVGSSLVYSSALSRRLVNYNLMRQLTDDQKKKIDTFLVETAQLQQNITDLSDRDNQLRKLLGLETKKIKISNKAPEEPTADLTNINEQLNARRASLAELTASVNKIRERFAETPSIWPIYGQVVSPFGYRYFPWRGLHTGVDITAMYGAPVRAAAAGVVTWAGWRAGYGRAVIIDHGYGLSTLYGHSSKLAVNVGSKVKKGQIICYIGISGLSTGPHLHYEVRRNDVPINPVGYLNLNIFSAARSFNRFSQGRI